MLTTYQETNQELMTKIGGDVQDNAIDFNSFMNNNEMLFNDEVDPILKAQLGEQNAAQKYEENQILMGQEEFFVNKSCH